MDKKTFLEKLNKAFCQDLLRMGFTLAPYIEKLNNGVDLAPEEACFSMRILTSDKALDEDKKAFLTGMHKKGPTVEEIAGFAWTLRKLAEPVKVKPGFFDRLFSQPVMCDTCGTGGGGMETFNISTNIIFILSSAGIMIAKHGNRAITSKSGSADVLEALGVNINLSPEDVGKCISRIKIGFIFAPNFHKAFKNVQKARKELSFPTVFNILGPLVNPAFATDEKAIIKTQILGVNRPELVVKMAEVLKLLNTNRALVVYGCGNEENKGIDEISTLCKTQIAELKENGEILKYIIAPEDVGIQKPQLQDLSGGTPRENAAILIDILKGKEKGPKRDIVVLNAGAGLYIAGKAKTIEEGMKLAERLLDNLSAYRKLVKMIRCCK